MRKSLGLWHRIPKIGGTPLSSSFSSADDTADDSADNSTDDSTDDPLSRERSHLAASRAALRAMREDVESLDISDVTANWVNAEVLAAPDRASASRPSPTSPTPRSSSAASTTCTHPAPSRPRARRASASTSGAATCTTPTATRWSSTGVPPSPSPSTGPPRRTRMDVGLRRRFGYTGGDLTAYEDEHLSDPTEAATTSKLLQREIERPRVGPMRDIVATIQPEQDEIVRSGLGGTVCVQGGPGTGKTAVGLHRVAYLLYAHRERLARTGTLVIGPNRSFLHYIEQVLPALGELEVKQATVDDLVAHVEVRGSGRRRRPRVVKGDARMAEVLRRAVRSHVTMPHRARRGRARLAALARPGVRTGGASSGSCSTATSGTAPPARPCRSASRTRCWCRWSRSGEAPDDRVQDAVARNPAVKAAVKAIWPPVDPAKLVLRLLSDADFLAVHAEGILTDDEQKTILWAKPARSVEVGHVVGGGRRTDRRGDRPRPAHALARPRRARRGAGPLPHAVPGGGPPLHDRLGDGPRRPRAGHHALGDAELGGGAGSPRQAGRGRRGADGRLPRPARTSSPTPPGCSPHIAPGLTPVASVRENPGFFVRSVRSGRSGTDAQVVACLRGVAAPRGLGRPDRRRRPHPGPGRGAQRRRGSPTSPRARRRRTTPA